MGKLAISGGKPVRPKSHRWPDWPISEGSDAKRLSKIVASNRWSYDGPVEWEFAEKFTHFTGAAHGMCVANGTVAIQLALEALGIGAYDEVIVPGLTWQATAAACIDVNAIPVLVDVEPDTWCIDATAVESAITPRTKAVIIVHLYGCMPDVTAIRKICRKHKLFLIEDCAHQHGSVWNDQGAGSMGDIGCFSFQETKVLSSGEGGFVTCGTKKLFERLYSLRNCGRGYSGRTKHAVQSGNYRLTEFQAGVLIGALSRLERQVKQRDTNAQYLNSRLEYIPGIVPMWRRSEVSRQSYFNFAFRIRPGELKGVSNALFGAALNAELHMRDDGFTRPYEPLNNCSLYKPHTKPRHRLHAAYWKAIDPERFDLPVCADAHERSGVVVHHHALMGTRRDMDDIARAVEKVVENIGELG